MCPSRPERDLELNPRVRGAPSPSRCFRCFLMSRWAQAPGHRRAFVLGEPGRKPACRPCLTLIPRGLRIRGDVSGDSDKRKGSEAGEGL